MLEIWPSHKLVVVAEEADNLPRTVNGPGLTRLLVIGAQAVDAASRAEALVTARSGAGPLRPTPRACRCPEVTMAGAVAESFVSAVSQRSDGLPAEVGDEIAAPGRGLLESRRLVASYRSRGLDESLALLEPQPAIAVERISRRLAPAACADGPP